MFQHGTCGNSGVGGGWGCSPNRGTFLEVPAIRMISGYPFGKYLLPGLRWVVLVPGIQLLRASTPGM